MRNFIICILLWSFPGIASAQNSAELQQTANLFMRQGDYANSIAVLNRALEIDPQNIEIIKNLSLSYYYQKDYTKGLAKIEPVLETEIADDQCFQIAGNFYKEIKKTDECIALFKKGIKKFPESGPMYNELGELLWLNQNYEAIKYWEKGIEKDPAYPANYYNASKYYYLTTDKVWAILYGEIFVNMEPYSNKTAEVKDILLGGYKKLFNEATIDYSKEKNAFAKTFLRIMGKQGGLVTMGITTSSLMMIRTRFILDWQYDPTAALYPYRLFQYHEQLLHAGFFESYNHWMFGPSENLQNFQNWTQKHPQEYAGFSLYQKESIFKMPSGQYYH